MSMVENMENEEFNGTTIEVEEDSEEQSGSEAVVASEEPDETRTKVPKWFLLSGEKLGSHRKICW